ncbi:putative metalloprotease CJM1_0395 family protein [Oceanibaculum sp.]|uniref:putative metalloprotease CJM1_0395 family protein n=1 Tax=Oceanibaculum sp. TaxID=1903597 RepID=UPI002583A72D|nr:putative metalloprotease CJM1_0395 family protein [Oceanibaculum sp.]MCH2396263.1 hypothetical protein [Oceanibaculum sp.]
MIASLAGTISYTAPGATASSGALSGASTQDSTAPQPQTQAAGNQTPAAEAENQSAQSGNGRLIDLQTFSAASSSEEEETTDPSGLTEEERAQVDELKQTDRKVRAHEQAHAAAGGAYASSPSYEYENGPDGNRYAIGGEVSIDVSPVSGDPEATIQKMEIVKRAALAPAEPSPQDRAVAAQADQTRLKAQAELREQRNEEQQAASEEGEGIGNPLTQQAAQQAGRAAGAYAQTAQNFDTIISQINIAA